MAGCPKLRQAGPGWLRLLQVGPGWPRIPRLAKANKVLPVLSGFPCCLKGLGRPRGPFGISNPRAPTRPDQTWIGYWYVGLAQGPGAASVI